MAKKEQTDTLTALGLMRPTAPLLPASMSLGGIAAGVRGGAAAPGTSDAAPAPSAYNNTSGVSVGSFAGAASAVGAGAASSSVTAGSKLGANLSSMGGALGAKISSMKAVGKMFKSKGGSGKTTGDAAEEG